MPSPAPPAIEIFISYAHKDANLWDELDVHLASLKREGKIQPWTDQTIQAGQDWDIEIKGHLESAQIILLLISPDFIHSDYCYNLEMKRALARHDAGTARVIPIILRHVDWQATPFHRLQALPPGAQPITSWSDHDQAYVKVVAELRKVVDSLTQTTAPSSTVTQRRDSSSPASLSLFRRLQNRKVLLLGVIQLLLAGIGFYLALPTLATRFLIHSGIEAFEANDWNTAEDQFNWAIRFNPNAAQAHFQLAKLYEERQQLDQAQHHYQHAIRGDILAAKNNLARLYIRAQDPTAAVNLLLQVLKTDTDKPLPPLAKHSLLKNLGWARLQQKNYTAAAERLETAIALETETVFPQRRSPIPIV